MKDPSAQRANRPDHHFRFAVCSDGSAKSLDVALFFTKLMQKGDHLVVIIVQDDIVHPEKIKESLSQALSSNTDIDVKYVVLKKEKAHDSADEIIVNYLMSCSTDSNYIDFVGVGNTGTDFHNHTADKKYVGSVAGGVIRKTNLNVLFYP